MNQLMNIKIFLVLFLNILVFSVGIEYNSTFNHDKQNQSDYDIEHNIIQIRTLSEEYCKNICHQNTRCVYYQFQDTTLNKAEKLTNCAIFLNDYQQQFNNQYQKQSDLSYDSLQNTQNTSSQIEDFQTKRILQNDPDCDDDIYNLFYKVKNAPNEYDNDEKKYDIKCVKKKNVKCKDYFVYYDKNANGKDASENYIALCIKCTKDNNNNEYLDNCLPCDDDQYYNPYQLKCNDCSENCTSCYFDFFYDYKEKCYGCKEGKNLINTNEIDFLDLACDCEKAENHIWDQEGKCIENSCPSGQYLDSGKPKCLTCVNPNLSIVNIDANDDNKGSFCGCPDFQFINKNDGEINCQSCEDGYYLDLIAYEECSQTNDCTEDIVCKNCMTDFNPNCLECMNYDGEVICTVCSKNGMEPDCEYCSQNQYYDYTNDNCFLDNAVQVSEKKGNFDDCFYQDYSLHCFDCTNLNKYCQKCTDIIGNADTDSICTECSSNRIPPNCLCPNELVPSKENPDECVECEFGSFYDKSQDRCLINQNFDCSYDEICISCSKQIHEYCIQCEKGRDTMICKQCEGDFVIYQVNTTYTSCQCPAGTFHYNLTTSDCRVCPSHAECPGGTTVNVKPGFWREDDLSFDVIECTNNPDACSGGSEDFICAKGYKGALCQECDLTGEIWGDNFGNTSEYTCNSCNEALQIFYFISTTSLMTVLTFYMVYSQVKEVEQEQKKNSFNQIFRKRGGETLDKSRIYYKILQQYFAQAVILTSLGVNMGGFFENLISNIGNPALQLSYTTDCLVVQIFGSKIPPLYSKIIFLHLTFFIYMGTSSALVTYLKAKRFQKSKKITYYNRKLDNKHEYKPDDFYQTGLQPLEIVLMVFVFLFMENQQSYVQIMVESISCEQISTQKYTIADSSIQCDSNTYLYFTFLFSNPILFLWGFGVPAFIFYKLRQASKRPKFSSVNKDVKSQITIINNLNHRDKYKGSVDLKEIKEDNTEQQKKNEEQKNQNAENSFQNELEMIELNQSQQYQENKKNINEQLESDNQKSDFYNQVYEESKQQEVDKNKQQKLIENLDAKSDQTYKENEQSMKQEFQGNLNQEDDNDNDNDGEISEDEFDRSEHYKNNNNSDNNNFQQKQERMLPESNLLQSKEYKQDADNYIKKMFFFPDTDQSFLNHRVFQFQFGFIYLEYEERSYFWDIVRIVQKNLLILIVSLYTDAVYVKGSMGFVVIVCYALLVQKYQPFKEKNINKLELQGTLIISVSLILVLFIYENEYWYLIIIGAALLILKPWERVVVSKPAIVKNIDKNSKQFYQIYNFKAQGYPSSEDINADSQMQDSEKSEKSEKENGKKYDININIIKQKKESQDIKYFDQDNHVDSTFLSPIKVIRSNQKFFENENGDKLVNNSNMLDSNQAPQLGNDNVLFDLINENQDNHFNSVSQNQMSESNQKQEKQTHNGKKLNNRKVSYHNDERKRNSNNSIQLNQILNQKGQVQQKIESNQKVNNEQQYNQNYFNDNQYGINEEEDEDEEKQNDMDISENLSQHLKVSEIEKTDIDQNKYMTNVFKKLQKLNENDIQDKIKVKKTNKGNELKDDQRSDILNLKIEKVRSKNKFNESNQNSKWIKNNNTSSKILSQNLNLSQKNQIGTSQTYLQKNKLQGKNSRGNQQSNANNASSDKSQQQSFKNNTNSLNNNSNNEQQVLNSQLNQELNVFGKDLEALKNSQRMGSDDQSLFKIKSQDELEQSQNMANQEDEEKQIQFNKKEAFQISQSDIQEMEDQDDDNQDSLII
ncbi:hypothetical protein PPERSA_05487 [Pseudocohnilembus persalinus]|uniref:Insulin-like growth factor binding protein, N-terminal n=1 Tax=Pseudocohnilembus persalinus TaxID=266149 RepID=A0A0V0QCQ6_PSEPJ|nr:hypothetical protein PPERSA_05487 [Pseudocohnilembus persalinus]|eukprot:KRW99984.1 hypothetical protein PPERSA_05487 [Pseudocohnilembus persalinus]